MLRASPGRQRGAVVVFAAIAIGAGLAALALAIDVGRLYAAQRDLQRTANLAALDAARVSGGCMGVPVNPQATALTETLASVARNGGVRSGIQMRSVEVGREFISADGKRYFDPDPRQHRTNHAVRVALSRLPPARLLPLAQRGDSLVATAAARSRPYASVHVGTRLVELDPPFLNWFLGEVFGGGGINIGAVGYTSLFEASVPLDSIIDTLDPDVPRIVFREVSVAGMLHGLVNTLAGAGNRAAAAAAAQIAAAADASEGRAPAEVIALEREVAKLVGSALIGAGELTLLTAQAATQSPAIELLYTLPPPLGDSRTRIRVIDPGRIAPLTPGAVGADEPNYAANSQALIQASVGVPIGILDGTLALPLWLQLAQATAQVMDIQCAREGQPFDVVRVDARASVSRLGIGEFDDIDAPSPQPRPATLVDANYPAGLLGIPVPVRVRISAWASLDVPSDRRELVFRSPFPGERQSIGGPSALALADALTQLPSRLDLDVSIEPMGTAGGGLPGTVDGSVQALIDLAVPQLREAARTRLVESVALAGQQLVLRVLGGTGLTLGGADVTVHSVVAKEPYLFTY